MSCVILSSTRFVYLFLSCMEIYQHSVTLKSDFHDWTVEVLWLLSLTVPFRSVLCMNTDHDGSVACGTNSPYAWWYLQVHLTIASYWNKYKCLENWSQILYELNKERPDSSPLKCQCDLVITLGVHFTMSILCISRYLGILLVFFRLIVYHSQNL